MYFPPFLHHWFIHFMNKLFNDKIMAPASFSEAMNMTSSGCCYGNKMTKWSVHFTPAAFSWLLLHWKWNFQWKMVSCEQFLFPQGLKLSFDRQENKVIFELATFKPLQSMPFKQTCKHPAPSETVSWLNLWPKELLVTLIRDQIYI